MRFTLPRPPPPLFWACFCAEFLQLSRQQIAQWWQALQRATGSCPVALRESIMCRSALGAAQGSVHDFVTQQVSPPVLIGALEDLIEEGVLPPATARQIEEAVLKKTHKSGLWV